MATNREMLAEAIADAKTLKEMAIANAKAALEETFTPQLKTMLSLKLQEMSDDTIEEDTMEETFMDGDDLDAVEENTTVDEINLEELLAEIENEENDETLNEAEESEEEETEEEEGEPLKLEDMTDEDLKEMIADVIADMVEAGELKPENGEEGEEGEGEEEIELDMDNEEDVDLAELLREIEEDTVEEGEVINPLSANLLYALEARDMIEAGAPDEEVIAFLNKNIKFEGKGNAEELFQKLAANRRPNSDEKKYPSLEEAYNTINTLRSELNEVNLLNAKLLYTNKIFKEKTLNESQKVKVLSSFDKATTVKEVKLVYSTLNEGLKVKTTPIRENLGRASKTTNTPVVNTKQPIVESNEVFNRMRKLAGLI
jgi:hypothetical protein